MVRPSHAEPPSARPAYTPESNHDASALLRALPFGRKPTSAGATVDFDAVYGELIAPGVDAAGLDPIRADQELTGGIIHTPMFERLILCEFAVADLTTANANVFYELGVRHAPRATFASSARRESAEVTLSPGPRRSSRRCRPS